MKEHWLLSLLISLIIVINVGFGFAVHHFIPEWSASGVFGDTFGAINSIFSGLAFAGLLYTILLQSRELKIQREELALTREQLTSSAASQKEQAAYTLLAAQIGAAISKQEIFANHYLNDKQFPGHENSTLGDMRTYLSKLLAETDKLVEQSSQKVST
ncbi:MAG: hypothetical protein QM702_05125 [Rubrivivax sp.]